jgi:DNA-binding NarL/FixJ family response regulator
VLTGMTNRAIALRLRVAPGTVKKHLDNVYAKLSVHGRGALCAFVLDLSGG